jgi:hypothetical protein
MGLMFYTSQTFSRIVLEMPGRLRMVSGSMRQP